MQKAFIYCRVSTEEQANEGHSLDTQEKFCRRFAETNDYEIAGVFKDEGKSGTNLDRPALQEMLTGCQQGKTISAVLVQETDRLARNTKDHLTIRAILQKAGVRLISVAQPMLDDSPEGKMIDTIIASVNQFQSDINSRKTKKGLQEKFDMGWWPGWAPLGYLNKEMDDSHKIVVRDPERWHLIHKGLKMYLTGNFSAIEISDVLYEKGLRSKTGKKICNSIMIETLKNPFYTGVMKWNGQEKVGKHEPMIPYREHQRILQIMNAHNLHACRRRKHSFLLRGFAFCNICGARYTAEKHSQKNNIGYYHCTYKSIRGVDQIHNNKRQNVEVTALENQVEEKFRDIEFSADFIDLVVSKVKDLYNRQKDTIETEKRALFNQRLAIEKKRDVAEEKLLNRTITDEDFGRIKMKLESDLRQIQDQIFDLDGRHTMDVESIRELLKLTTNIYETYRTAPYELKRQFLGLFWDKFLVEGKRIVTAIPSRLMVSLIENKQVIILKHWLPG